MITIRSKSLLQLAAFSCAAACAVAGAGCALDSSRLYARVAHVTALPESDVNRLVHFPILASDVSSDTQEVVTQTYFRCDGRQRRFLLGILTLASIDLEDGRWVPLLCHICRFSDATEERRKAATALGSQRSTHLPYGASPVAIVLGEGLMAASEMKETVAFAESLTRFLERECGIRIYRAFETGKLRRIDVDVVKQWWSDTGRALAEAGELDHKR